MWTWPAKRTTESNEASISCCGRIALPSPNFTGTSAAAPQVAGVRALVRIANPSLSATQVRAIVEGTAQDGAGASGEDTSGWEKYHGHGLVDASAAVAAANSAFVIYNDGGDVLNVTSIQPDSSAPWISVSPQPPFPVQPGGTALVPGFAVGQKISPRPAMSLRLPCAEGCANG
jgi:subtilisin family serine protease